MGPLTAMELSTRIEGGEGVLEGDVDELGRRQAVVVAGEEGGHDGEGGGEAGVGLEGATAEGEGRAECGAEDVDEVVGAGGAVGDGEGGGGDLGVGSLETVGGDGGDEEAGVVGVQGGGVEGEGAWHGPG